MSVGFFGKPDSMKTDKVNKDAGKRLKAEKKEKV